MRTIELKIETSGEKHKLYIKSSLRWKFLQSFLTKMQLLEFLRMLFDDTSLDVMPIPPKKK